jgi:triacylglycerol esterase/lipase EstA (alpha/beta hydrolase family)
VRGGRIDLVCHSLGGVVARCWLQELGGARRVDRCITLSTPHRGTYGAYWVASRIGRELRPDSLILQRLEASRAGAERVKFTSVVAGSDNIVFPRVFASHEELVHVPDVGHVGMLFSPTVLRTVADRL